MLNHLPVLIILFPLGAALLCPILSYFNRRLGRAVVCLAMGLSLASALIMLGEVTNKNFISYDIAGYRPPVGIEFYINYVNILVLILICIMGLLSTIYGLSFMTGKSRLWSGVYYSILSLLVTGMLGMTITGDVFNFYVFLEITSISGYALIAMGTARGVVSAFRYLLIGTIGASFYLLGVAFLYGETGTLNMYDMSGSSGPILTPQTTLIALGFFVIGFGIKMALFPLHGWQPSAYTNSHPAAAPIIAGVMGKIPAYGMVRFFFFVFNNNSEYVKEFLIVIGILGSLAMMYGSLKAMRQNDIRRMLAYSSIAQIGYVAVGIGIGGGYGLVGAILHIINHSFMKGGLFFAVGAIYHKYGVFRITQMGKIYRHMPITTAGIVIFALSMIGIPPTGGFFSKWYLAIGAINHHLYAYVGFLLVSSLLNCVYFFRLLEKIFAGKDVLPSPIEPNLEKISEKLPLPWDNWKFNRVGKSGRYYGHLEAEITLLIPIVICLVAVMLLGFCNQYLVKVLTIGLLEVM